MYLVPRKFLIRASAFPVGVLEGTGWVAWEVVLPHGEGWKPSDRCVPLPAFPCSSGVKIRSCQDRCAALENCLALAAAWSAEEQES